MELQLRGITVRHGGIDALHRVDLDLSSGEALALLGDRGAGKTTLFHFLSGRVKATEGSVTLDGSAFIPRRPESARRAGLALLGERPLVAPHLSAAENLLLGIEPARHGWIDPEAQRRLAREALAPVHGDDIPLDAPAGRLSLGQQRRIEIARVLLGKPRALLIDTLGRPSHAIPRVEHENLAELALTLAALGYAILYACRAPEEAARAHRTVILREGTVADTMTTFTPERAWKAMISPFIPDFHPHAAKLRPPRPRNRPALQLSNAAGRLLPRRVSLEAFPGEIFGLAGLPGSGAPELLQLISGQRPLFEGEVRLDGQVLHKRGAGGPWKKNRARTHTRALIGLMSTRRSEGQGEALIPHGTIAENLILNRLGRLGILGSFSPERLDNLELYTRDWMEKLRIYGRSPWHLARELSRGNQRMLVLGRLFQEKPRLLLLDDPTRGVSGLTKSRIYQWLRELAHEGRTILLHSPNVEELLALCDTIAVLRHGVLKETRPATAWSAPELVAIATGAVNTSNQRPAE